MTLGSSLYNIAVCVNTLVRCDAAPVQSLDDIFFSTWHESLRVSILDSDNEVSSALLGEEVVIESSPDSTHVKRTCW